MAKVNLNENEKNKTNAVWKLKTLGIVINKNYPLPPLCGQNLRTKSTSNYEFCQSKEAGFFFILWRIEAKKGERGLFFVDNDPDDARKLLRCT